MEGEKRRTGNDQQLSSTSRDVDGNALGKTKQSKWLPSKLLLLYLLSIGTDALDKIRLRLTQGLH